MVFFNIYKAERILSVLLGTMIFRQGSAERIEEKKESLTAPFSSHLSESLVRYAFIH